MVVSPHTVVEDEKDKLGELTKSIVPSEDTPYLERASTMRYIVETFHTNGTWWTVSDVLFAGQSKYQNIKIFNSPAWGKALMLDGQIQSSEFDEHLYHEALVQPALLTCATPPKRVLICGGGELASAREVLKHPSVEECVMIDLDGAVVEACKKHIPSMHGGCIADPRFSLKIGDAVAFVRLQAAAVRKLRASGASPDAIAALRFDAVIMDICDPMEAGPGNVCYFEEFYRGDIYDVLTDDGVFVTQSGPGGFQTFRNYCTITHNTLARVFDRVDLYTQEVPSFAGPYSFNMAYKKAPPLFELAREAGGSADAPHDGSSIRVRSKVDDYTRVRDAINASICERFGVKDADDAPLRSYDGETHVRYMTLPKVVRKAVKEETRVFTKETQYVIHH